MDSIYLRTVINVVKQAVDSNSLVPTKTLVVYLI